MPPTIVFDQIKGFSLFMIEAVLDRRGNEIIESTLDEQDIFERPCRRLTKSWWGRIVTVGDNRDVQEER